MKISLLNEKITIQKSEVEIDDIGNHKSKWIDYLNTFVTISSESPDEVTSSGNVWDETKIDFTLRWSKKASEIVSKGYRVLFKDSMYEIKGIDHMNYKKNSIKLHCNRIER